MKKSMTYFGDAEIDMMNGFKQGVTQAMTSSFMVKFKDPASKERVLVDIGLNVKSW